MSISQLPVGTGPLRPRTELPPEPAAAEPGSPLANIGCMPAPPELRPGSSWPDTIPRQAIRVLRRARQEGPVTIIRSAIDEAVKEARAKQMTRRQFLKDISGAAGGVVGALVFGDVALDALVVREATGHVREELKEHWKDSKPAFKVLGELPENPTELVVYLPGFGDRSSAEEAETIRAEARLDPDLPFGYFEYSESGATMDQLEAAIREQVPNLDTVKSITLIGRSMGGPYAIGLAYRLGIPVKVMLFISSPYGPRDGDFGALGVRVAKLPAGIVSSAGVEFGVNSYRNASRDPRDNPIPSLHDIIKQVLDGYGYKEGGGLAGIFHLVMRSIDALARDSALSWAQVMAGADPQALKRELQTWAGILLPLRPDDLTPQQYRRFRKVFQPDFTKVLYTATDHPTTDGTVKVVSSAYDIWNFFVNIMKLPAKDVLVRHLPYDGHANVNATASRVRGWFQRNVVRQQVLADGPAER